MESFEQRKLLSVLSHGAILRLWQILDWGTNHPIISLVILLFALALLWSIIKAIMRLIERASWSILQIPLKLIQALIQVIFISLTKFTNFAIQKIKYNQQLDTIVDISPINSETIYQIKQQRLADICHRLEVIQQEQKELLQEVSELITDDESIKH